MFPPQILLLTLTGAFLKGTPVPSNLALSDKFDKEKTPNDGGSEAAATELPLIQR
jgi:hypothetical protein